jgi:hypothetical protein
MGLLCAKTSAQKEFNHIESTLARRRKKKKANLNLLALKNDH